MNIKGACSIFGSCRASFFTERRGIDAEEFYADVREVKDTTKDPKVQEFVYCLLASCDYDSFYSVMVREAGKLVAAGKVSAPPKAESKVRLCLFFFSLVARVCCALSSKKNRVLSFSQGGDDGAKSEGGNKGEK